MRTFTSTPIGLDDLHYSDLREEARLYDKPDASAYEIVVYRGDGVDPYPEKAQALYLPYEDRLGIAWGGDATWASVRDVETGIEMWLNDSDGWAAAN